MCRDRRFHDTVPLLADLRAAELKSHQRGQKIKLQALEQEQATLKAEEKKPYQGAFRHQQIKSRLREIDHEIKTLTAEPPQKEVAVA